MLCVVFDLGAERQSNGEHHNISVDDLQPPLHDDAYTTMPLLIKFIKQLSRGYICSRKFAFSKGFALVTRRSAKKENKVVLKCDRSGLPARTFKLSRRSIARNVVSLCGAYPIV